MTFTVTYRGADGAVREECVEAAGRGECFVQCRACGIAPISVKEGASHQPKHSSSKHSDNSHPSTSQHLNILTIITALLALTIIGGGAWWWLGRDKARPAPEPKAPKKPSIAKEVMPVNAPKAAEETPKSTAKPAAIEEKKADETNAVPVEMYNGMQVVGRDVRTNQSGAVIEKLRLSDGQLIESVHPPKPLFSNPSDQLIAMALSAKPGQSMAPMPDLSSVDSDFAKSFLTPIRIEDDDSEEVKALKLAVKEARAYIAAEVKKGRTVQECLNEHCRQIEQIADSHQMALLEMRKLKEEGAAQEEISQFRERVNEVFRAKGIPELPTPVRKKEEAERK